ncbi:MAG TPA: globin, partial [Kofleriaceae bacterium]|nr:globin [Kofleriaceae bacterium]
THVLQIAKQIGRPLETLDRSLHTFCERLHELVIAQLGMFSADARALLDAVSILDEPFTAEIAADIAELTPTRVADVLAEVATAGLVVHARDRWAFAQGLVRCVLERDLIPSRRAALHARAAASLDRWLGTPPSQLERIARHYVAGANVAHAPRALELVRRAARAAIDAHAFGQASCWLSTALDLEASITPADPMRRREVWLELAKTLSRDGQVERAAEAFAAAESVVSQHGHAIRAAFFAIAPALPQIIDRFYALLFERYPVLRDMFGRSAPLQRRMFGEAIAALADHADDPDWLHGHLEALGRRHAEYGVTNEMYDWARIAFMDAMSDAVLPRRLPPDAVATWDRTFSSIAESMKSAGANVQRITSRPQTREPVRPPASAR